MTGCLSETFKLNSSDKKVGIQLIISDVGKSNLQFVPLGFEQSCCIEILREPVRLKERVWEWCPRTRVVEYKIFGVNCIGYGVDLDNVLRTRN